MLSKQTLLIIVIISKTYLIQAIMPDLNQPIMPQATQITTQPLLDHSNGYTPTYYLSIPDNNHRPQVTTSHCVSCWYTAAACGFLITFLTTGMILQNTQ